MTKAAAHLAGSSHGDGALRAAAGAAEVDLLRGSRGRRRAAEVREAGEAGGAREGPRRRSHSLSRCCGWWEEGEARLESSSRPGGGSGSRGRMMRAAAATG